MAQNSLRDWIAVLSEAGAKIAPVPGLRAAAEAAGRRLELEMQSGDLAMLSDLEDMLNRSPKPNRDFTRLTVCHIPQLEDVPSAPVPSGEGDGAPERQPYARQPHDLAVLPPVPPWGFMATNHETLRKTAVVPIHWKSTDGSPPTMRTWKAWRAGLIDTIDAMLWPVYKPDRASWCSSAVAKLFEADFQLLAQLHWNLRLPIDARYPTKLVHNDLYMEEDDPNKPFGTGYERHDPTVPPLVLDGLTTVLIAGMGDKVGSLDLQLMAIFQRPRPYQVAFIQNRPDFSYVSARTGSTPSLVNGHALHALVAGCTACVAYAEHLSPRSVEVLQQFTVDIGDRRVFAGVNYPSDNLASWLVALSLIPHVFSGEQIKVANGFLWSAISSKSQVFAATSAYKDSEGNSPYSKILGELARLGAASAL
jgi:hypothetical protein